MKAMTRYLPKPLVRGEHLHLYSRPFPGHLYLEKPIQQTEKTQREASRNLKVTRTKSRPLDTERELLAGIGDVCQTYAYDNGVEEKSQNSEMQSVYNCIHTIGISPVQISMIYADTGREKPK